jgi:predicted PurR-regulated permease PerM
MNKKIIFFITLIFIIIIFLFLSQKAISNKLTKNIISDVNSYAGAYLSKGSEWVTKNIYTKIQDGGEAITNSFEQAKENITQEIPKKVEKYFSGIKDAIAGKENNNCAVPVNK